MIHTLTRKYGIKRDVYTDNFKDELYETLS